MARPAQHLRQIDAFPLDRSDNLALPVPAEEAPGADEVHAAALSVAVADAERDLGSIDLHEDYEEYHERGFYHPYD